MSATSTAEEIEVRPSWPDDPYKGLSFYSADDVPLFAGREADIRRVARLLGTGSTRVLLLHGTTGCGKSSFLHAGLVPYLENQLGSFHFARDARSKGKMALLVRSTDAPLLRLAAEIQSSLKHRVRAEGSSSPYLRSDLLERFIRRSEPEIRDIVTEDPEQLIEIFREVAYVHPRTQVIVVDQAEEMVTLRPDRSGDAARDQFFEFLAFFTRLDLDLKLIIAFRTEYHGRLYSLLSRAAADTQRIKDYYLDELDREGLISAIERPTLTAEVPGYGSPRQHYRFVYEEGLPEEIANDLLENQVSGSMLPVLQIVCRQLFRQARAAVPDGEAVVFTKSYRKLRLAGQIDRHIEQALDEAFESIWWVNKSWTSVVWRDVLSELSRPWPDGTVTTDLKTEHELRDSANTRGSRADFKSTMAVLESDQWKIVRPVLKPIKGSRGIVKCYGLGHDVLGSVLYAWQTQREQDRQSLRRGLRVWVALLVLLAWAVSQNFPWAAIAFAGLAALLLLISFIPNRRFFRWLYNPIYGFVLNTLAAARLP